MRVIIPENSNGNESSKIPPISKKYDIAILVFESSSKENISLHNISEKELFLDQYKEKIKAEIIDAITNKLSHQEEESKTQITEKNISNNLKIIEKSKIDLAEISSDEYTEESQANGEKVSIEQKYPKKDIEYYVNVWKTFSKYGDPIENTYIIPSKTFYMSHKAEALKGSNDYYSLIDCLEDHKKKGIKIEKIIDINFSNSYYNFYNLKKKFKNELSGIEYLKIPLTPKEIPSRKELNRIYDILNKNISKKQYIIIHCTNGVVRTGYVLVYFLCKRFEYSVEKSLKVFEQFRGHKLVNEILINDLKQKFQQ